MIRAARFATVFSVCLWPLAAQVNESELRRSYPIAADGNLVLDSGVELKAVFDRQGRACLLTLRGEVSENQVLRLFDTLAPAKSRGVKKQDIFECVGVCQREISYENVTLATGAVAQQRSEPAAIIGFTRAECKDAVAEAKKTVLHIERK
jgi:hypothetical protein